MRRLRAGLVAAVLALGSPAAGGETLAERDRAAIEALERRVAALPGPGAPGGTATLAERMAEARVPAVGIAYLADGRIVWTRAYGVAAAGTARAVTPRTRFQAASMSKAVSAAGALRLVDRGRLTLDGDVGARLRGWTLPAAADGAAPPVTLRQLLSHGAGLSVGGYAGYPRGGPVPTLIQSLAGTPPATGAAVRRFAAPGAQFAYSGGGYSVAQLLMEETAGIPFARLLAREVLDRASMRRSSYDQAPPRDGDVADGHDGEGRRIAGGSHVYPELAAAGLWTTPADYARFVLALQDSRAGRRGALLSPASAAAMTTPVLGGYGLGVTVLDGGGRLAIYHGGANEGYRSRFFAFLDGAREGLVVMTNGDEGGRLIAAIQRTLGQAYGWREPVGPPGARAPDR